MSMTAQKSSGAIGSHSFPLHLPQVALSSYLSTVCLLSSPVIMNMDVSVLSLFLNRKKQINDYCERSFDIMHIHYAFC